MYASLFLTPTSASALEICPTNIENLYSIYQYVVIENGFRLQQLNPIRRRTYC